MRSDRPNSTKKTKFIYKIIVDFYCATASIQSKIINLVIMRDCLLIISLQAPIRIDLKQIAQLIVCQHSVKLIDENQNVLLSFKASEK